jgi:hypothetical protein
MLCASSFAASLRDNRRRDGLCPARPETPAVSRDSSELVMAPQ